MVAAFYTRVRAPCGGGGTPILEGGRELPRG